MREFSNNLLEEAVNAFASLPGIGKKTAMRLVLHLLKKDKDDVMRFGHAFINLRNQIQYCKECHNIAAEPLCDICNNQTRSKRIVCVVEDIRDVFAIENTKQFGGVYHVLGGKISPMDGIGPSDLNIQTLVEKVNSENVDEVILALSATMEGDTTNFYLYKKIAPSNVKITTIARGVSFGDELEYADELTLGRSILQRTPYEQTLVK